VLQFDVSQETLACTSGLDRPGAVNLERSLRLGDPLGGHLVAGHVDGVGEVVSLDPVGDSIRLRIRVPNALARYVARKGSICVDGVSLTVNAIRGRLADINLIPHTLRVTTLSEARAGLESQSEADLIARWHAERMLRHE
jgi:riboflavin synthase